MNAGHNNKLSTKPPMNDETRAAAERLRDHRTTQWPLRTQDMNTIIEAYLAEHPADDAEPITGEWLRTTSAYTFVELPDNDGTNVLFEIEPFGPDEYRPQLSEGSDMIVLRRLKTRGDLRRLCAALGVPLTEDVTQ